MNAPRVIAGPNPMVRRPTHPVPRGACDSHIHVFPDPSRYPLSPQRSVTPPIVTLDDYRQVMKALGIERVVVVQTSIYGDDNSGCLDACEALGEQGRSIAVVSTAGQLDKGTISSMHRRGCRGLRFNLWHNSQSDPKSEMLNCARKIADAGWHLQVFANAGVISELAPFLGTLPVPVVVDHFGMVPAGPQDDRITSPILSLLATGRGWIKLSAAYRLDRAASEYSGMADWAGRLVKENPERLLWGSDWPHPDAQNPTSGEMPDTAGLLDTLTQWRINESVIRKILVGNPCRLYGFAPLPAD